VWLWGGRAWCCLGGAEEVNGIGSAVEPSGASIWLSKSKLHHRPLDYDSSVRREEATEFMPRGS
jgi:hypothetical protein